MPRPLHRRAARRVGPPLAAVALALWMAPAAGAQEADPEAEAYAGELAAEPETPVIYKWVDENGIAHYTTDPDRIPAGLRSSVGRARPLNEREPRAPSYTASDAWVVQDARRSSDPYAIRLPGQGEQGFYGEGGPPGPDGAAAPAVDPELEERIAAVRAEIERDQEVLKSMLAGPSARELTELPEFREIAHRLPQLQANLRALERQRPQPLDESPEPDPDAPDAF